jgi:tRNA threonylcarbamoyladenosine biosynthesis protein TsaB
MSTILNIDTSLSVASVCIAKEGKQLVIAFNREQQDHAAWLHPSIQTLLSDAVLTLSDLTAVAVTIGPGSYTGLRVGLASAKGYCYALKIPLIAVNTLTLLAYAAKPEIKELVIPVIDARRMEIYTAVYDKEIREKISTYAMILAPDSFSELLDKNKIIFCGNAIEKVRSVVQHPNATYTSILADAGHLGVVSQQKFVKKQFTDITYCEPLYVKEFYSPGH